jgi:hypothetical protein
MPSFDVIASPSKAGPLLSSVEDAQKKLAALSLQQAATVVSASSTDDDDEISVGSASSHFSQRIGKTEHKLAEERGELADEPLLKENPHRFVLFPIQDDEVRSRQKLVL